MKDASIAIVDTSFWIHLVKVDLLEIFLEYYSKIIFPSKVEAELTFFESFKYKVFIPLDVREYRRHKKKEIIIIKDPLKVSKELESQVSKNSGEIFCIALSLEKGYISFIDNGRPYDFCKKNNILVSNIIEFMLFLYFEKKISKKDFLLKIKLIERLISKEYLKNIESYLK